MIKFTIALSLLLFFNACDKIDDFKGGESSSETTISGFNFIGEQIITDGEMLNGQVIGGLSGIDYCDGTYYLISDDPNAPIRFYKASLEFDENSFDKVTINSQVELLDENGNSFDSREVDPEAIRFDKKLGTIVWTSEGYANNGVDPFVRQASIDGKYVGEFSLPTIFKADTTRTDMGIRNNGVFEGLTLSANNSGYWVGMELPLIQDGEEPVFGIETDSKIRIAYINRKTGKFGKQFTYPLGPVVRDGGFTVNGLVELLEYDTDKFLVLERSYATGYDDGGNDVFIYKVDATNATDVSNLNTLNNSVIPATKELLFSFNNIRSQLSTVSGGSENVVDNLEGITFGPDLPNGNKSLVIVSDNNFSAFGAQLNQFIVLEVLP